MSYLFGEFELTIEQRRLARNGNPVSVEPKVFDVLVFLIENRDRVVTRDELLDHRQSGGLEPERDRVCDQRTGGWRGRRHGREHRYGLVS